MAKSPQGRAYAAGLLLIVVAGAFVVKPLIQRGHAAEEGFVVTGEPLPSRTARQPAIPQDDPPTPAPAVTGPAVPGRPVAAPLAEVVVHMAGAVNRPGVYHLSANARVADGVTAAGGLTVEADADALNLAARVTDGARIYVPRRNEQPRPQMGEAPAQTSPPAVSSPPLQQDPAPEPAPRSGGGTSRSGKFTQPGGETLNLNTASAAELERLPGVGPAMSARILEFRQQNGPFTAPEQIMNVRGIGEARFAKMRPYLRVQ